MVAPDEPLLLAGDKNVTNVVVPLKQALRRACGGTSIATENEIQELNVLIKIICCGVISALASAMYKKDWMPTKSCVEAFCDGKWV
ncbi:hypothetical protein Tco_0668195 [Tanacetum coccineum]